MLTIAESAHGLLDLPVVNFGIGECLRDSLLRHVRIVKVLAPARLLELKEQERKKKVHVNNIDCGVSMTSV
jgi:hypothetical protein